MLPVEWGQYLKKTVLLAKVFLVMFFCAGAALLFCHQAMAVQAGGDNGGGGLAASEVIVLRDGENIYVYPLAVFGLEKVSIYTEGGRREEFLHCRNPQLLSQKVEELAQKLRIEAVSPQIIVKEGIAQVLPGVEGRELDREAMVNQFRGYSFFRVAYPLIFKKVAASITADELSGVAPDTVWAAYATVLVNNPPRTENVRLAARSLNNLLVAPGATVSFNETVGPRVGESGYQEAPIVVAGRFEPGLGGGVCQVSSTLYNTLLLAGLEIVERHNHSVRVAYVPLGRDATVAYGSKDLKFRNNTGSFMLIKTSMQDLRLEISIWGHGPNPAGEIFLENRIIKRYPPRDTYVTDSALSPGEEKLVLPGQEGYLTETFQILHVEGNKKRELLSRDYYAPINRVIAVNNLQQ